MSLRDDILAALRAAGDGGASGEAIARDAGVSRAAVAKHVTALKALGYRIEARLGEGYVLVGAPDLAIPPELAPLLRDPFWVEVTGGVATESTNDDARALAQAGAAEGTVVVASRQTAGRGRLGRQWESPSGGAYLSVVLRPDVPALELAPLPLVIALGVAQGLEVLGASPRVKWPNDVELVTGKVAGILLEMSAQSDRADWVVAGIGLNVTGRIVTERAAALSDELGDVTPAQAAAAVLDEVAAVYRCWCLEGFEALSAEYEARHRLHGEEVTVWDMRGAVVASGIVIGVDGFGRLVLRAGERTHAVSSGDVTLRA